MSTKFRFRELPLASRSQNFLFPELPQRLLPFLARLPVGVWSGCWRASPRVVHPSTAIHSALGSYALPSSHPAAPHRPVPRSARPAVRRSPRAARPSPSVALLTSSPPLPLPYLWQRALLPLPTAPWLCLRCRSGPQPHFRVPTTA